MWTSEDALPHASTTPPQCFPAWGNRGFVARGYLKVLPLASVELSEQMIH